MDETVLLVNSHFKSFTLKYIFIWTNCLVSYIPILNPFIELFCLKCCSYSQVSIAQNVAFLCITADNVLMNKAIEVCALLQLLIACHGSSVFQSCIKKKVKNLARHVSLLKQKHSPENLLFNCRFIFFTEDENMFVGQLIYFSLPPAPMQLTC